MTTLTAPRIHNRHEYGGWDNARNLDKLFFTWSTRNNRALEVAFHDDDHAIWKAVDKDWQDYQEAEQEYRVMSDDWRRDSHEQHEAAVNDPRMDEDWQDYQDLIAANLAAVGRVW